MSSSLALASQGPKAANAESGKNSKAPDPRDDVSGEQFNTGIDFFARWGFRQLQRAMLKQTVDDVIAVRKNRHAPPEIHVSANWARTERGQAAIEFLMPGVDVETIVAALYDNPDEFRMAMDKHERDVEQMDDALVITPKEATLQLESAVAAQAFGEKPEIDENDCPLDPGASHFDEHSASDSLDDSDNIQPGSSWG